MDSISYRFIIDSYIIMMDPSDSSWFIRSHYTSLLFPAFFRRVNGIQSHVTSTEISPTCFTQVFHEFCPAKLSAMFASSTAGGSSLQSFCLFSRARLLWCFFVRLRWWWLKNMLKKIASDWRGHGFAYLTSVKSSCVICFRTCSCFAFWQFWCVYIMV